MQQNQPSGGAVPHLQAQARSGDMTAELKLARAYESGEGVPKNEQKAFDWYRKAAEQGNAEAQDIVGEMYRAGEGVDRNKQAAIVWYQRSAKQGNASAMCDLGVAYYNGDGVDVSDSLSYAWFLLAKEAGCERATEAVGRAESELHAWTITDAFDRIAEMYDRGDKLPTNHAEAARWWLKAAERGDGDAQLAIAARLISGAGVMRDPNQGKHWCQELLKKHDTRGNYCMGYFLQYAVRDSKKARKEYERAAAGQFAPAMKVLAEMDASGQGGKVDRVGAALLYARLIAARDAAALRSLAALRTEMSQTEWNKVEKQLHVFHIDPRKLDAALQQIDSR
jgi:uncharacterized protein